jgi:hypothetical protein
MKRIFLHDLPQLGNHHDARRCDLYSNFESHDEQFGFMPDMYRGSAHTISKLPRPSNSEPKSGIVELLVDFLHQSEVRPRCPFVRFIGITTLSPKVLIAGLAFPSLIKLAYKLCPRWDGSPFPAIWPVCGI